MSFNNQDITSTLEKLSVKFRSNLMDEKDRVNGKLTRWKTGRRFAYIDPPTKPLPKTVQIGPFRASIYHRGQQKKACTRCLSAEHSTAECSSDIRCRVCHELGHVSGDPVCALAARPPPPPPPPTRPPSPPRTPSNPPPPTRRPSPSPPPTRPSSPSTIEKKQDKTQTKLCFSSSNTAAETRRARSATSRSNGDRGKRGRSLSAQRSPQQTSKTPRVRLGESNQEETPSKEGEKEWSRDNTGT